MIRLNTMVAANIKTPSKTAISVRIPSLTFNISPNTDNKVAEQPAPKAAIQV